MIMGKGSAVDIGRRERVSGSARALLGMLEQDVLPHCTAATPASEALRRLVDANPEHSVIAQRLATLLAGKTVVDLINDLGRVAREREQALKRMRAIFDSTPTVRAEDITKDTLGMRNPPPHCGS